MELFINHYCFKWGNKIIKYDQTAHNSTVLASPPQSPLVRLAIFKK
jgi:hypothetical protein